jgi:hypothetical protein
MPDDAALRTEEDLQRVVRALAREFKTDTVFIIGSQAILMSWPDAPGVMRASPEIDALRSPHAAFPAHKVDYRTIAPAPRFPGSRLARGGTRSHTCQRSG